VRFDAGQHDLGVASATAHGPWFDHRAIGTEREFAAVGMMQKVQR